MQTRINNKKSNETIEKKRLKQYDKVEFFEKRMIISMILFMLAAGLIVFAPYTIKLISREETTDMTEEESRFKSILTNIIADLSDDNLQYVLDEHYYNEAAAISYISVLAECTPEEISRDTAENLLWNIFIPIKNDNEVSLIQKDNETLIAECDDKLKMNKLDYIYMGTNDDELAKMSKGVYISQNNDEFEKLSYGNSNVKKSGCGPISLTMALNYVYGCDFVSLEEVLKWAEENDMYEENSGTRWSLIRNFPKTVSADCCELYIGNIERFETALSEGGVLIASMNKGHFTDSGHFIVITEIKDGFVSVLDPASIYRSLKKWDTELIFNEANKYFWRIGKEH